jgi:large subunit ribosomal protein L53
MITRFLTEVRVTFNPFALRSKPARLFLSLIPPSARADGMKIDAKMLPRESKEPASLAVKFSTFPESRPMLEADRPMKWRWNSASLG